MDKNVFVTSCNMFSEEDVNLKSKIESWNSVVGKRDKVYVLGNFCDNPITFTKVVEQLNGEKEFIVGEHDDFLYSFIKLYGIYRVYRGIIKLDQHKVILSYEPLRYWKNKNEGWCHLFGYSFSELDMVNRTCSVSIMAEKKDKSLLWTKPVNIDTLLSLLSTNTI